MVHSRAAHPGALEPPSGGADTRVYMPPWWTCTSNSQETKEGNSSFPASAGLSDSPAGDHVLEEDQEGYEGDKDSEDEEDSHADQPAARVLVQMSSSGTSASWSGLSGRYCADHE